MADVKVWRDGSRVFIQWSTAGCSDVSWVDTIPHAIDEQLTQRTIDGDPSAWWSYRAYRGAAAKLAEKWQKLSEAELRSAYETYEQEQAMQHPVKEGTIEVQPLDIDSIAAWLETAWTGISPADAAIRIRVGSDDCPHLSMTEKTRSATECAVYGPWGCHREVFWEMRGRPGEPVDIGALCRRTAEFCVRFARSNGRIALALRAPGKVAEWRAYEDPQTGKKEGED